MYNIVKRYETIKIKKDCYSVFAPVSGFNHACSGRKVGGGNGEGVMALHLVK